eukprot:g13901.t1
MFEVLGIYIYEGVVCSRVSGWLNRDLIYACQGVFSFLPGSRFGTGTTSVTRGSWADQQGIRCGDEFMSVDRKRSRAFTSKDFTETMKKRPLQIKLRRTARKEGAEANVGSTRWTALTSRS